MLKGYMDVAMWTWSSIQVVTYKNVTYTFTNLNPGEYIFKLYINSKQFIEVPVKITQNTVNQPVDMVLTILTVVLVLIAVATVIAVFRVKRT